MLAAKRRNCLARRLGTGLAMLLAVGCMAWSVSEPELKIVRVRKVPPIGPPIWRVDLHAFGYADHISQPSKTPDGATISVPIGSMLFLDESTLAVTFVRRVPGKMTSRDRLQETSPLRLQAISFEAGSGRVRTQRDWGISSAGSYVVTGHSGKFVLRLGQKFVLYSLAMEALKELELPPSGKEPKVDFWWTNRSPSGRRILLVHEQAGHADYQVLDSEALTSLESWSARGWLLPVVADDKLAVMSRHEIPNSSPNTKTLVGDHYEKPRTFAEGDVAVRRLGGAWTVVCNKGSRCGSPFFVNNDVLALWGDVDLRFIRADGQPLSPEFRIGEYGARGGDAIIGDMLCASARGDRLAVPLFLLRPYVDGDPHLCDLARGLVFDLPSGQWIASLEARQHKIERICDLALSPDGTHLALFRQEGIVEVYPLPASPAAPQGK